MINIHLYACAVINLQSTYKGEETEYGGYLGEGMRGTSPTLSGNLPESN